VSFVPGLFFCLRWRMGSTTRRTRPKLQLDLPLAESASNLLYSGRPTDPAPSGSPSGSPSTGSGHAEPRVSFQPTPQSVVTTAPNKPALPAKTPSSIDIATSRKPYHSLGRTEQDAATNGTKLTVHALTAILDILRRLDAARGQDQRHDDLARDRGSRSADPAGGPEDHSSDSGAHRTPATPNRPSGTTIGNGQR